MKTFFITTITFLAFSLTCKAQWTTATPNIYNSNTGNVLIGATTSSIGALQISGGVDLLSLYSTGTNPAQFDAWNSPDFRIIQRSNGIMTLWTNTIERMRIDQNGNVGIGITTPTSKLAVASTSNNNSIDQTIAIIQSSGLVSFGGYIGQRVVSSNTRQGLVVSGGASLTLQAQAYNMDFIMGAITPSDDTNLRMRILANGNVGIGTTAPDQKLTVNGTIHSSSVLVDANVPTPDYVFKKDYSLPTLAEIKTYTDKNHHLPGIAAAAEIEKNGINVGEMSMALLKKVEELTLYLIEKDKQLSEQQKTISSVKQQLDNLTKQLKALKPIKENK